MGFCSCINKLFLVALNFFVFAIGVGVIILGSVVVHRGSNYGELLFEGMLTLPIWTLIIGIIITLIGFFGCCGAMKEDKCMLITYASVVSVLFLAEVVLGVLVALYPNEASGHIKDAMMVNFKKYGGKDKSLEKAIDAIQHDLKCCGVTGIDDWPKVINHSIPASCCVDQSNCDMSNKSTLFQVGCFDAIVNNLKGVTVALGIAAIVLAIVQVVCIFIACGLGRKRSEYV